MQKPLSQTKLHFYNWDLYKWCTFFDLLGSRKVHHFASCVGGRDPFESRPVRSRFIWCRYTVRNPIGDGWQMEIPMNKAIIIVTHGPKAKGPNPPMTEEGRQAIHNLRKHLIVDPPVVCIGEAQRHFDVAEALGYGEDSGVPWMISSVFGACGSLELGKEGEKLLILADGRSLPFGICTSGEDAGPSVTAKLRKLPEGAVICAGREILIALGVPLADAKSGALYAATACEDGQFTVQFIASGMPAK